MPYVTRADAHAALSAACVSWGRSQAAGMTHEAKCERCAHWSDDTRWRNGAAGIYCVCRGTGKVQQLGLPSLTPPAVPSPAPEQQPAASARHSSPR
jgi:hypothetical protein